MPRPTHRPTLWITLPVLLVATAACGGDDAAADHAGTTGAGGSGGSDTTSVTGTGGDEAGGGFSMAAHEPFPQLTGDEGSVIAHLELVTITFAGYTYESEVQAFGDSLVGSDWLSAVGADYGVSLGEHAAKVVLPEPAPESLDDPTLLEQLDQLIEDGTLPAPGSPTSEVIYLVYLPAEIAFDDGDGYFICDDYYGYHWQAAGTSGPINYGIIGDCGRSLDEVTATASHEIIETATDRDGLHGYGLALAKDDPWYVFDGFENADLCDGEDYHVEDGFSFQLSWSNTAASTGVSSPCVPAAPGQLYYNVSASPATLPEVEAGSSATFTLTGWSSAETADWSLTPDPGYYGDFAPGIELDTSTINNGGTATLKVTVPAGTPPGQLGDVIVYSGPGYGRYWPVGVWSK